MNLSSAGGTEARKGWVRAAGSHHRTTRPLKTNAPPSSLPHTHSRHPVLRLQAGPQARTVDPRRGGSLLPGAEVAAARRDRRRGPRRPAPPARRAGQRDRGGERGVARDRDQGCGPGERGRERKVGWEADGESRHARAEARKTTVPPTTHLLGPLLLLPPRQAHRRPAGPPSFPAPGRPDRRARGHAGVLGRVCRTRPARVRDPRPGQAPRQAGQADGGAGACGGRGGGSCSVCARAARGRRRWRARLTCARATRPSPARPWARGMVAGWRCCSFPRVAARPRERAPRRQSLPPPARAPHTTAATPASSASAGGIASAPSSAARDGGRLALQLVPADDSSRAVVAARGGAPLLELVCRPAKALASVASHLKKKWGGEGGDVLVLTLCVALAPRRGAVPELKPLDGGLAVGALYEALARPAPFRISYRWSPAQGVSGAGHTAPPPPCAVAPPPPPPAPTLPRGTSAAPVEPRGSFMDMMDAVAGASPAVAGEAAAAPAPPPPPSAVPPHLSTHSLYAPDLSLGSMLRAADADDGGPTSFEGMLAAVGEARRRSSGGGGASAVPTPPDPSLLAAAVPPPPSPRALHRPAPPGPARPVVDGGGGRCRGRARDDHSWWLDAA